MYEPAYDILRYLPLRSGQIEGEYIDHLKEVFYILDCSQDNDEEIILGQIRIVRPFSIMAYHLLFMLVLQYKILRIARELPERYNWAFSMENLHDNLRALVKPSSVFDIALLSESKIADLLKLIHTPEDIIINIKKLVRNRNDNLAHAKGGIEADLEARIDQYLDSLRKIQICFEPLNRALALKLHKSLPKSKEERVEYISQCIFDSYLCLADFESGEMKKFTRYLRG